MIAGIFHEGSGLGDQLFRYITIRTLAEEKGFEWGMSSDFASSPPDEYITFKGGDLFEEDCHGEHLTLLFQATHKIYNEKKVVENGVDIRSYDPEINFIQDNTIIDGSFEDDKYWGHNLENINKWLKVEPLEEVDNLCVIGFRGGEYASDPNLFLTKDYYDEALKLIQSKQPEKYIHKDAVRFEVHTDDPTMAVSFFNDSFKIVTNTPISHSKHTNMGFNWRSARFAKYAIIPNSAFFILPRLLKHFEDPTAITIAPRYWARRNTKVWARPACYYKQFIYI